MWYSSKIGLFSARQHLCLSENFWDAENSAATGRYYIVDAVSGEVTRHALSMQAYTDDQYRKLLRELGFRDVEFYPALSGQKVEENSQFIVIVSRNLKYQILSLLRIVWPEGFVGENKLRDWISRDEDHSVSVMLVEQDILISHTEVVWKYLDHAGEIYKAYGLTGVFTYPAFRGQGYGKQIVERGTAYIDASDADIGIFHCAPNLKEFYAGCGWISMEKAVTLVGSKNNPQVSNELTMMRFLTEKGARGRPAFEGIPFYFGEDTR